MQLTLNFHRGGVEHPNRNPSKCGGVWILLEQHSHSFTFILFHISVFVSWMKSALGNGHPF